MRRSTLILAITALLLPHVAAQEPPSVSLYRIGPRDKIQLRVDELEGLDAAADPLDDPPGVCAGL